MQLFLLQKPTLIIGVFRGNRCCEHCFHRRNRCHKHHFYTKKSTCLRSLSIKEVDVYNSFQEEIHYRFLEKVRLVTFFSNGLLQKFFWEHVNQSKNSYKYLYIFMKFPSAPIVSPLFQW